LFLTVVDSSTGKTYYEIYHRREQETSTSDDDLVSANSSSESTPLKGLNSFCLIVREEVPAYTNNLFTFADIDRDAMVDLLFVTKNDLSLHIYFNKLPNQ
jgi:hypothetical protein